jgi:ferredoxin
VNRVEKPKAIVEKKSCLACGGCVSVCSVDAITMQASKAVINKQKCISCGTCISTCPIGAITWEDSK